MFCEARCLDGIMRTAKPENSSDFLLTWKNSVIE
jgi:hypothetical protein